LLTTSDLYLLAGMGA